jgi:hypothetical protein
LRFKGRVDLRVVLGKAREVLLGLLHVRAEHDEVVLVERTEEVAGRQHLEAELGQLQFADHLGMQQAHDVGEDREGEAGHDLLRDRRAADHVAALQHQRLDPRLGQVGAAGQTVVATPDDDRVVALGHVPILRTRFR